MLRIDLDNLKKSLHSQKKELVTDGNKVITFESMANCLPGESNRFLFLTSSGIVEGTRLTTLEEKSFSNVIALSDVTITLNNGVIKNLHGFFLFVDDVQGFCPVDKDD